MIQYGWCKVPKTVRYYNNSEGTEPYVRWHMGGSKRRHDLKDALRDFCGLAGATESKVIQFVQAWGPLIIDVEEIGEEEYSAKEKGTSEGFIKHTPAEKKHLASVFGSLIPSEVLDGKVFHSKFINNVNETHTLYQERIGLYTEYAAKFAAALRIVADAKLETKLTRMEDWETLKETVYSFNSGQEILATGHGDAGLNYIGFYLNKLLAQAGIRFRASMTSKGLIQQDYSEYEGIFSLLVYQLFKTLTSDSFLVCPNCEQPFAVREGRAKKGACCCVECERVHTNKRKAGNMRDMRQRRAASANEAGAGR